LRFPSTCTRSISRREEAGSAARPFATSSSECLKPSPGSTAREMKTGMVWPSISTSKRLAGAAPEANAFTTSVGPLMA